MKRKWTTEELDDNWSLDTQDLGLLLRRKKTGRLGLIAQPTFHRRYLRFPEHRTEFSPSVLHHLAEQIDASVSSLDEYQWNDRKGRRHREAVLRLLGVRTFDRAARLAFRTWLRTDARPREPKTNALDEWINEWLAQAEGWSPSADTRPHFPTIAGFVSKLDREIVGLLRDVLLYASELGLLGKEHFAVDGCRLPSNASKQWGRGVLKRIARRGRGSATAMGRGS